VWLISRLGVAGWPATAHALAAPRSLALGAASVAVVTGLVFAAARMRPLSVGGRSIDVADVAALGAVATLAAGFAQGALDPATLGRAVFLGVYRSTLDRSRRDELAYAAPTPFRVSEDLSSLIPVTSVPLRAYPGETKLPVLRLSGNAPRPSGSVGFTLLGLPARSLPSLDGWRDDFSSLSPRAIAAKLAARTDTSFRAIPLPRRGELTVPMTASGDPLDISATFVSATGTFKSVQVATPADRVL